MRLIDADALMEASKYEFWQDCSAITPIGEYILGKFRKLIRNMPTIEPERKSGKWTLKPTCSGWYKIVCSQCGYDITGSAPMIGFMPEVEVLWNCCPNCGAYMKKENT